MKNAERVPVRQPDRVLSYFENQRPVLAVVTVSGLIYNLGLVVSPWFEGQLAQCLLGILNGNETFAAMAALCAGYLIAIAVVQGSRFIKRLYVRKFANNINRSMKQVLYANLVRKDKVELEQAGTGTLMTKAISDVDACAEGMRKFTTEIFDTGIALLAYAVMLLGYDWRLALLCLVFAPISYYIAEQMKTLVQRTGAANKESTGRLSAATLDRVSGALTYRVYGCEPQRDAAYEACLQEYERTAVKAGLPVAAMPPLYGVISMTGVLFIFTFGARNVAGTGWAAWDIAAFTTFLSCFGKLAVKSSHAAKLFNAVQKAQVSWGRIKPLMCQPDPLPEEIPAKPETLTVNKLGFAYRGGAPVLQDITFTAQPGRIFGITGAVDLDYSYQDYLPTIRAGNFNGYGSDGPDMTAVSGYKLTVFGSNTEYFYTANLNDVVGYLPLGSYPVTQITKEKYNGYDWVVFEYNGGQYWTALIGDRNRLERDDTTDDCSRQLAEANAKIAAAKAALE
jgi:ATP-binding cassette subfamily B multidrug efflux pump